MTYLVLFVVATSVACEVIRFLISTLIPERKFLTHLVGAFQGISNILFGAWISEHHGAEWAIFCTFLRNIYNMYRLRSWNDPSSVFLHLLRQEISVTFFTAISCAQYVTAYWALQYVSWLHKITYNHPLIPELCKSSLKVSLVQAFIIETAATFLPMALSYYGTPHWKTMYLAAFCTLQTNWKALSWRTGMMYNPLCAFVFTFNCVDESYADHIIAYVVGPFVAVTLFHYLTSYKRQKTD